MDRLHEFLDDIKAHGRAQGLFLGLLHVLIGRRIDTPEGVLVANGMSWREAAAALKKVRWDREAARELGLDPDLLPPRDRQRFWFMAIAQAGVDSPAAIQAADRLAARLHEVGYVIGPPPGSNRSPPNGPSK